MDSKSAISGYDSYIRQSEDNNRPSPLDFVAFLPWACGQLEFDIVSVIKKSTLSDGTHSNTARTKANKEDVTTTDTQSAGDYSGVIGSITNDASDTLNIDAVYDSSDSLVQLKFYGNLKIPAALLKLLTLIVQFQPYLTAIYINRGLNKGGLYQLNKVVIIANITDVILDDTAIEEANYYVLLEDNSPLKYLSLSRCRLNDIAVKMLSSRLQYPLQASKTLSVLNLSSNIITDEGAKYIGDILRTNRQLAFLNLAGNMISDTGAACILNSLITFPLTSEEINEKKERKFIYLKEKKKFINETVEQMRIDYETKYAAKKKNYRLPTAAKKTKSVEVSQDLDVSLGAIDAVWFEKAEAAAELMVAPFQDPFSLDNLYFKDGVLYCNGNNTLCYINLAYNNLSYYSIKKLHTVLTVQNDWDINPKGLANVCIEGNRIPISCDELSEINLFLELKLARMSTASVVVKKKTGRTK